MIILHNSLNKKDFPAKKSKVYKGFSYQQFNDQLSIIHNTDEGSAALYQ
jgi:hypothetical protein